GDDDLYGDDGVDTIRGGLGDDFINGGFGNNKLFGDEGNDILLGHSGHDQMEGGIGADLLSGGAGNDLLRGGLGDDVLIGGIHNDRLYGDEGSDLIFAANISQTATYQLLRLHDDWSDGRAYFTRRNTLRNGTSTTFKQRVSYTGIVGYDANPDQVFGGDGKDWIFAGANEVREDDGDDIES
ncbi:MAG: alkaline phosphatase, partial [Planctomycetota bacterium]